MKIAVTGATGQLGTLVIQALSQQISIKNIVALVRNTQKAQHFSDLGIEVRLFDYNQVDTLQPALEGIDRLLLISGSEVGQRVSQHQAVIDAAIKAAVPFIAYTSILNADTSLLSLADEHKETEALIQTSGLAYALLRNNWYLENYLGSLTHIVAEGKLYGAAGVGKISAASRQDYAQAAAHVLISAPSNNPIYELASSEDFTLPELASIIATVYHTDVEYINLTPADYSHALCATGLPQGLVDAIVDADVQASHGGMYSDSTDLSRLIGHGTTPVQQIIEQQKVA